MSRPILPELLRHSVLATREPDVVEFEPNEVYARACASRLSRKCDNVGLLGGHSGERHPLRLRNAMLTSQVAVGFHCERAAVLVAEPAGHRWNINAAFDANGREQMA